MIYQSFPSEVQVSWHIFQRVDSVQCINLIIYQSLLSEVLQVFRPLPDSYQKLTSRWGTRLEPKTEDAQGYHTPWRTMIDGCTVTVEWWPGQETWRSSKTNLLRATSSTMNLPWNTKFRGEKHGLNRLSYDMAQFPTLCFILKDSSNGERKMSQKTDSQNKYNLVLKVRYRRLIEERKCISNLRKIRVDRKRKKLEWRRDLIE
jgi:hypothetical protein